MRVSRTLNLYRGLVAGVVGVLACIGTGPALAATSPDTLVVGKAADPQTLDPAVTIDNNDWTVVFPAYQRLMQYRQEKGRGSTEVEGDLARSWKVSDHSQWDIGYAHLFISSHIPFSQLNGSSGDYISGQFKGDADILGIQYIYKF